MLDLIVIIKKPECYMLYVLRFHFYSFSFILYLIKASVRGRIGNKNEISKSSSPQTGGEALF